MLEREDFKARYFGSYDHPIILDGYTEHLVLRTCKTCGAAVSAPKLHHIWHIDRNE